MVVVSYDFSGWKQLAKFGVTLFYDELKTGGRIDNADNGRR